MIVKPSEAAPLSVLQFAELSLIAGRKPPQSFCERKLLTCRLTQFLPGSSVCCQVMARLSFLSWHHTRS